MNNSVKSIKLQSLAAILVFTLIISSIPFYPKSDPDVIYAQTPEPVMLSITKGAVFIKVINSETINVTGTNPDGVKINSDKPITTPIEIVGDYDKGIKTSNNIGINGGKNIIYDPLDITINNVGIETVYKLGDFDESDRIAFYLAEYTNTNIKLTLKNENYLQSCMQVDAALEVPSGSKIEICGTGKLTATGGEAGAVIGGKGGKSCGSINISGGTIAVDSQGDGAGIGSGSHGMSSGNISISGGNVSVNKDASIPDGSGSAGIGGGANSDCGTISISGGVVDVEGNTWASAIGGGNGGDGGRISITGGKVYARTKAVGASIGGGMEGSGANVTISGNDTYVYAGGDGGCGDIGAGESTATDVNGGSIDIDGGAVLELGQKGIYKSYKPPILRVGECEITGAGLNASGGYQYTDLVGKYVKLILGGMPVFDPERPAYLKTNGNVYTVKIGTKITVGSGSAMSGYDFVGWFNRITGELFSTDAAFTENLTAGESGSSTAYTAVWQREENGNIYIYIDYPYNDDLAVCVGGEPVDSSKVKVEKENGDVKLTVLDSYRNTLEQKEYILSLSSADLNINSVGFKGTFREDPIITPTPPAVEPTPPAIEPTPPAIIPPPVAPAPVIQKFMIALNTRGGTGISVKVFYKTKGSRYGTLPTPKKKGYSFSGWFSALSGGSRIYSQSLMIKNANHTLYARWIPKKYTVKLNANKGKVSKKKVKIKYRAKYGKLPVPKRKGCKFIGWFTKKKGGVKIKKTRIMKYAKTTTLYAHWKKK